VILRGASAPERGATWARKVATAMDERRRLADLMIAKNRSLS